MNLKHKALQIALACSMLTTASVALAEPITTDHLGVSSELSQLVKIKL